MRTRYLNHDQMSDAVNRVAVHEIQRLDQRLADLADDLTSLDISLQHHLRDDTDTARLMLRVPGTEIVASGTGPHRETALRDAFADLIDEVEVYVAKLRSEPAMRREAKFHRDKAELARDAIDSGQDWPSEPPLSAQEATTWVAPHPPPSPRSDGQK